MTSKRNSHAVFRETKKGKLGNKIERRKAQNYEVLYLNLCNLNLGKSEALYQGNIEELGEDKMRQQVKKMGKSMKWLMIWLFLWLLTTLSVIRKKSVFMINRFTISGNTLIVKPKSKG